MPAGSAPLTKDDLVFQNDAGRVFALVKLGDDAYGAVPVIASGGQRLKKKVEPIPLSARRVQGMFDHKQLKRPHNFPWPQDM